MCFRKFKSAFTLIELLVVVVIVAILAAVSYSGVLQAINAAKETACLENIGTLSAATHIWIADNGGVIPEGRVDGSLINPDDNWYDLQIIPTYLPAELRCPLGPNTAGLGFRYAINDNLRYYFPSLLLPVPSSRVVLVSEMYYFGDGLGVSDHLTITQNGVYPGVIQAHSGGLNLGFLDGHAELIKAPLDPNNKPNWAYPPAYAHNLNSGYYYDETQFYCLAKGIPQW